MRESIPEPLRRRVLVEAGHRCAIPTCRHTRVEIAHIEPWSKVKEHSFENLIALCANCHDLYDKDKKIDHKSMKNYKHNLGLLNHRYSDLERRILEWFCQKPQPESIKIPGPSEILVWYLAREGIIRRLKGTCCRIDNVAPWEEYQLTDQGKAFIEDLKQARHLD